MIQIVVLIIWQDRDCNFFQQYGTAPAASAQTTSDSDEDDSTTTVSPQQCQKTEASNYQTLQDYNDAVANATNKEVANQYHFGINIPHKSCIRIKSSVGLPVFVLFFIILALFNIL